MLSKKSIISILIFVLVVLVGFLLFLLKTRLSLEPQPQLISVSPDPGAKETSLLPEITATFSKPISPKQVLFTSIPSFDYQSLTEKRSTNLKYLPQNLLQKTTIYQITLRFKSGGEYSWSFTTGESEAGAVPGWAEGTQKLEREYRKKYPLEEVETLNNIIEKVVGSRNQIYSGDGFWISYASRGQTFAVHLCQEPLEETKKKAEDWFVQQGWGKIVVLEKPTIDWLYGCEPPKIIPKVLPTP